MAHWDITVRSWVEQSLHEGKLKLVVCTSSLDLGVDFRPVDSSRSDRKSERCFLDLFSEPSSWPSARICPQRSFFVLPMPWNWSKLPPCEMLSKIKKWSLSFLQSWPMNVLIQFFGTLAVGEGFDREHAYRVAKRTRTFSQLSEEEMDWMIDFITKGGNSLGSYEDFLKVSLQEDGLFPSHQ